MKKHLLWLCAFVAIVSLCWTTYRDYQIEKIYTSDLRNRIVGARLQKDGKLPYFYKWKPEDGVRYYDSYNIDSFKVANITATPFFHELLYPIADWEQRTISRFWVLLQYLILITMTGFALVLAKTLNQKVAVLATATTFLFTEAWINLIAPGQNYLFIPLLAMLCYFCLTKTTNLWAAFFSGLFAVSLVLVRPNTFILFLPLLLIARRYSMRYKIIFFIPVVVILGYIAGNDFQRALWMDYRAGLSEQLKIHQDLGPARQVNSPNPDYEDWEGWNRSEILRENETTSYVNYSENGNFFVLVRDALKIRLSPEFLAISSLLLICFLFLMHYWYRRTTGFTLYNLAILGFCLYMLSDLFSPVFRHQYYTVQWFFPLLLAASGYQARYKGIYLALVLGLVLNIINSPYLKMEHTIGEYLIFAALLLLAFVYHSRQQTEHQSSIQH